MRLEFRLCVQRIFENIYILYSMIYEYYIIQIPI